LAHKFYETTRLLFSESARPYLHGEIVGAGLLLQNRFNNETERNAALIELMKKHSMPYRISDFGVTEESFSEYFERIKNSSAIDKTNEAECEKFKEALRYFWDIK
jgi:glycerol dehydrogenase-like iron-containing ADH family enzyme